METDLTYTNKAGISLKNVLDVLVTANEIGKKDIQTALKTDKNIDVLLKKLEAASLIEKKKTGNKLLYTVTKKSNLSKIEKPNTNKTSNEPKKTETEHILDKDVVGEKIVSHKRIVNKAKPKRDRTPAEVNEINKQTESMSKESQITSLVEEKPEEKVSRNNRGPKTKEVNEEELEILKKNLETRLGKEVTAVLHKRNDRVKKERKQTAKEIYEKQQAATNDDFGQDNPYRFVLNFFTSTLNGEKATPFFRRRDEYVVKSIYNKFKSLCDTVEDYAISPQNLPFYRVMTINVEQRAVKMYHIDMNRIVRGQYTIFRLNQFDDMFITFKE